MIGKKRTSFQNFLKSEVEYAIQSLKNEKCNGNDGIAAKYLKYAKFSLANWLKDVFNQVLVTEKFPEQWKKSEIILIHKNARQTI